MIDTERQSQTTFNMSLATLERIDLLLRKVAIYRMLANAILTDRIIRLLYKELYPFITEEERKLGTSFINDIHKQLTYDLSKSIALFDFTFIDAFDYWIRDKLNEKGLLMAKSDDPSHALGG